MKKHSLRLFKSLTWYFKTEASFALVNMKEINASKYKSNIPVPISVLDLCVGFPLLSGDGTSKESQIKTKIKIVINNQDYK